MIIKNTIFDNLDLDRSEDITFFELSVAFLDDKAILTKSVLMEVFDYITSVK